MRVGDVYRIQRMITDGYDDKAIHARFKNDYSEDEVAKFIKSAHDKAKPVAKPAVKKLTAKPKSKTDPLS